MALYCAQEPSWTVVSRISSPILLKHRVSIRICVGSRGWRWSRRCIWFQRSVLVLWSSEQTDQLLLLSSLSSSQSWHAHIWQEIPAPLHISCGTDISHGSNSSSQGPVCFHSFCLSLWIPIVLASPIYITLFPKSCPRWPIAIADPTLNSEVKSCIDFSTNKQNHVVWFVIEYLIQYHSQWLHFSDWNQTDAEIVAHNKVSL